MPGGRSTQIPDGDKEFFAWLGVFKHVYLDGVAAGFIDEVELTFNFPDVDE